MRFIVIFSALGFLSSRSLLAAAVDSELMEILERIDTRAEKIENLLELSGDGAFQVISLINYQCLKSSVVPVDDWERRLSHAHFCRSSDLESLRASCFHISQSYNEHCVGLLLDRELMPDDIKGKYSKEIKQSIQSACMTQTFRCRQ